VVSSGEGAGEKIFLDSQMGETVAPLHDLDATATDEFIRGEPVDPLAHVFDRALGDIASFRPEQVGNRL
jgi:hypothetical protein